MFSAYLATLSDSTRVRANAAEYIERALSPSLRELVLPLCREPGVENGLSWPTSVMGCDR